MRLESQRCAAGEKYWVFTNGKRVSGLSGHAVSTTFTPTLELGKIARAYRSDPYSTIPIYARYWYRIRKSHISYDIPDFGDSAGVRAWIWCPLVTIGGSEGLL